MTRISSQRTAPAWSAACLLALLFLSHARAIGNRTHAEISERAADRYCTGPQAMVPGLSDFMADPENRKALYSGSTFPDWGYGTIAHDAAEQCHWTPFHDAFLAVLKERMQLPWTAEDGKNVAFFLGDLSHSVSDNPWHFNAPDNRSFIGASSDANGCGHTDCDTGADVYLLQRADGDVVPGIGFGDFFWPTDLLVDVYQRAGRTIAKEVVRVGGVRQQGYWLIAKEVSNAKIGDLRSRCPWIGENLDGYYFGGLDHDAAAVSIWMKHYFARLRGDYFFQNAPLYGRGAPDWVGYEGCIDTTIFAALPESNAGEEPVLELLPGAKSAVLLRFDLAELPIDIDVAAATLWLATESPARPPALEIAPCTAPWIEGNAATDPVSGAHGLADGKEGATWARNDPAALAWAPVKVQAPTPGWLTLDLAELVNAWAHAPEANHGFAIRLGGAPEGKTIRLFSSEAWKSQEGPTGGERVAFRPALVVETAKQGDAR